MVRGSFAWVLIRLLFIVVAARSEVSSPVAPDKWLRQWLSSLEVALPDIETTIGSFPPIHLTISEGVCSQFGLSGIDTKNEGGGSVSFAAHKLVGTCNFDWTTKSLGIANDGTTVAEIGGDIQGIIALTSDDGNPVLPWAILNPSCNGAMEVSKLEFKGGFMAEILEAAQKLIKGIVNSKLGQFEICGRINALVTSQGSQAIQNVSSAVRLYLDKVTPTPQPPSIHSLSDSPIDFSGNSGLKVVGQLIDHVLMNATSPYSLNALVTTFLGPVGKASMSSSGLLPFSMMLDLGPVGTMNVTLRDGDIAGLNTFSKLQVDAPAGQNLAFAAAMKTFDVNASITLVYDPKSRVFQGASLQENFDLNISLNSPAAGVKTFLALNGDRLSDLAINQLPQVGCVAPSVDAIMFTDASINKGAAAKAALLAKSGDGLEQDLDNMINTVVGVFMEGYSPAIGEITQKSLGVGIRDALNEKISNTLAEPLPCGEPQATYAVNGVMIACAVLAAIAALDTVVAPFHPSCKNHQMSPADDGLLDAEALPALDVAHFSLATHPRIPRHIRVRLPLLTLVAALLIACSDFGEGAHVRVFLMADGQEAVKLPEVSNFSLLGSFHDMWEAKVYPLALLIIVFSGAWPFIRLGLLVFCWYAPPQTLSIKWRQRALDCLDLLGRWSLPNCYMLMVFNVAFNFTLSATLPEYGISGDFKMYVDPSWAFSYCYLTATCLSIFISNAMCSCHRKALMIDEYGPLMEGTSTSTKQRLNAGSSLLSSHGPTVMVLISLVLVVLGASLQTVQLEFLGLLGQLLGKESLRSFSIFELMAAMPSAAVHPQALAVYLTQALFLLWVVLFSLANLALVLVLWAVPLTVAVQRRCFQISRILNAWGALDVFAVSLVVVMLEIRQFATFIVGNKCDPINKIVGEKCFDLKATLPPEYWVLVLAAVFATGSGQWMQWKCARALFPDSKTPAPTGQQLFIEGRQVIAPSP